MYSLKTLASTSTAQYHEPAFLKKERKANEIAILSAGPCLSNEGDLDAILSIP
jgi:hypothetical protein